MTQGLILLSAKLRQRVKENLDSSRGLMVYKNDALQLHFKSEVFLVRLGPGYTQVLKIGA